MERSAAPGRHGRGRDALIREHDEQGEDRESRLRQAAGDSESHGIPAELWFEEAGEIENAARVERPDREQDIAGRLNRLFEVIKNERTGKPYTNADLARMSLGEVTETDIEDIRAGTLENPAISQVVALAEAFGVHPSYFLDTGKRPTLLGEQEINALGDQRVRAILNKSLSLSDQEKDMVLDMIQHLGKLRTSQ